MKQSRPLSKGKPILVTGATGLLGNNVVRMLLTQGHAIRVLVREHSDARCLADLDIARIPGDVRDLQSVRTAMRDVSAVVHSAGYVKIGWAGAELYHQINVIGTQNVAVAARENNVGMVHVSSCDALPALSLVEPTHEESQGPIAKTPYASTKAQAETEIMKQLELGLDASIVNPGFMLGPWDWKPSSGAMLVAVAKGQGLFAPPGSFSLCDARDVAAGIINALAHGQTGRRYVLAGQTMTYLEAWRLFADVAKSRRPLARLGPLATCIVGRFGDAVGRITKHEPPFNSAAFLMSRLPKHYSSERARRELGYTTRPARETVQSAFDWFREYGYLG